MPSSSDSLLVVQEFRASENAGPQHKIDRLVSFLADEQAGDILADALVNEQAQQKALLKQLGGTSLPLAVDVEQQDGSSRVVLANELPKDLVADALAKKNAEEEELLKKLTGGAKLATIDQGESMNRTPLGDLLLDTETSTQANGELISEDNPELVDQLIDALANTNDDGTGASTLLTSEFNGETSGEVKLQARDSTTDMADQVVQYLAVAAEPNMDEALLAEHHSGDLEDLSQLLATGTAIADEKVDQVVAFLASVSEREYPDSQAKYAPTLSTKTPTDTPEFKHDMHENRASAALALEATTTTAVGQLRAPQALSMEQDHLPPHMMLGGAFLLVAAILLTVMTKRSRGPRPSASPHDEAYAYFLHE